MEFSLSREQVALRDNVQRYCREHYDSNKRRTLLHSATGFSMEHWTAFADLGWLGAALPEEVGGYGGSIVEMAVILEEFGRALVLEPYLFSAVLSARAVCMAADHAQSRAVLEPMILGSSLLALAHRESDHPNGASSIATTAQRLANGGFTLQGAKRMVLGGNHAHRFIVSARTSGELNDSDGVSLFLLEHTASGLSRRSYRTLDGRGAADLHFNAVHLDEAALLGVEGAGFGAAECAIDWAIVGLCAEALGSMDSVISTTLSHLKTRRTYGSLLSEYQSLQHRIADMLVEFEMSRSIFHFALATFTSGDREATRRAASSAKALIGRAGNFIAANGIQLHGATGMLEDYVIGQQFKRLTVVEALFGNSDFHLSRRLQPLAQPA